MIKIQFRPDPVCARHLKPYSRKLGCLDCKNGVTPGQPARRAVPTRPGKTKQSGHQPYPCPVTGCGGTVRGGFCPRSDKHQ